MQKCHLEIGRTTDSLKGSNAIVGLADTMFGTGKFNAHGIKVARGGGEATARKFLGGFVHFGKGNSHNGTRNVIGFQDYRLGTQMQASFNFGHVDTGIRILVVLLLFRFALVLWRRRRLQ